MKNLDKLSLSLGRSHESVDRQGAKVAANLPRYTELTSSSSNPKWESLGAIGGTQTYFLGSGYDHDGVTPLAVLYDSTNKQIKIYRNDDFTTPALTRTISRTVGTATHDILDATTIEDATHAYVPFAGVVCHGLISLLCLKQSAAANPYIGISIITLQATSSTATDWFSVGQVLIAGTLQQLGNVATYNDKPRGAEWCMSNYFPDRDSDTLLGAWFPFVDYCHNPGSVGGQVGVMYAKRSSVGSQWTTGNVALVYDTVQTEGSKTSNHIHSAACHQHDKKRLVVTWAEGDSITNNVVRSTVMTHASDIRNNYSIATKVLTDSLSGTKAASGAAKANQWVAACPSSVYGDILVTCDEDQQVIHTFTSPDPDNMPTKLSIKGLYGKFEADRGSVGTNTNQNSLWIHCAAPERKEGYVARLTSGSGNDNDYSDHGRILYSSDGLNWNAIGKFPASAGERSVPFIFNNKICTTNFSGGSLIYGCDKPSVDLKRGIMVRSGYTQHLRTQAEFDDRYWTTDSGTGNSSTPITQDADGNYLHPVTLEPIPSPPCLGPVQYVVTGSTSISAASYRISNDNTLADTAHALCQAWVYVLEDGMTYRSSNYAGLNAGVFTDRNILTNNTWIPVTNFDTPSGQSGPWYLKHVTHSNSTPMPSKYLIAFSEVSQNGRMAGTPVGVSRRGNTTPIVAADEKLEVTGFTLGSQWSIGMSLRVPEECWDTTVAPKMATGVEPLFTLRLDDNNYIYVYAHLKLDWLVLVVSVDGQETAIPITQVEFYRLDSIRIAVSNNGATTSMSVIVGGQRGGETIKTTSYPQSIKPTSIRFADKDWSSVAQIDVFDVVVEESKAYTLTQSSDWITGDLQEFSSGGLDESVSGNHFTFS